MLYTPAFRFPSRKPTGAKLALKPFHVWGIRVRLQVAQAVRDLALFDLALDSKLRGCDLVQLRVSDLVSANGVKRRVMILQQKTGRPVQFEVTEQARRSIAAWVEAKQLSAGDRLFPSRMKPGRHLTTRQYARLVDKWVTLVGLDPVAYGTHSLRRTKAALLYKKTGNLRACQLLLGHTKLESTVRYLGVEVDDALELSESLEL
jgi:integrase